MAGEGAKGRRRTLRGLLARAGYAALPRLGYEARRIAPGAVLVTRPVVAGRHWMTQERELFARLALDQLVALLRLYRVNCVVDASGRPGARAQRLRRAGFKGEVVTLDPEREDPGDLALPAKPRVLLRLGARTDGLAVLGEHAHAVVALEAQLALLQVDDGSPGMCEALDAYEREGFEIAGLYPLSRQARTARVLEYEGVLVRAAALSKPRFPTRGSPPRSPSASAR